MIEIEYIINPNCLKVDIAITFLKSISVQATNPEIKQVNNETLIKNNEIKLKLVAK